MATKATPPVSTKVFKIEDPFKPSIPFLFNLKDQFMKQGMPVVSPDNMIWDLIPPAVLSIFESNLPIDTKVFSKLPYLGLSAAPIAATLYNWAADNQLSIPATIPGQVGQAPLAKQALERYVTSITGILTLEDSFIMGIDALTKYGPLSDDLCHTLRTFYYTEPYSPDVSDMDMMPFLAPKIGGLPPVKNWWELRNAIATDYPLSSEDYEILSSGMAMRDDKPWHLHIQRMDLVLCTWLTEQAYLERHEEGVLDTHLSRIKMSDPDELTALTWSILTDYKNNECSARSKGLIEQWMQQYPEYSQFVDDKLSMVVSICGDNPLDVARHLNALWQSHSKDMTVESWGINQLLGDPAP